MRWTQRIGIGPTMTVAVMALFLTGCPKRPEVVETVPRPIAPHGEVGMPAPKAATPEEKSPTEIAVQPPDTRPAAETGVIQEARIAEGEIRPDDLASGGRPDDLASGGRSDALAAARAIELNDIYFDFDQSAIREDSKKQLNENVEWFRKNPSAKVTIEGHSDERGSSEYNLAAGVTANRIGTISFGKERPFVVGHDESAWKWNRRAHFVPSAK
jgi:peptidoglycan-associated lipoprotein